MYNYITASKSSGNAVRRDKSMHDRNVVLLVEDEQRILRFMSISLKAAGYRVITATSGEKGLDLVQSEKPDIVLLDIFLPGMSGLEALRKLRTYSHLPVIVISAGDSIGTEALALGANAFIAKPFKPDQLVRRMKAILGK